MTGDDKERRRLIGGAETGRDSRRWAERARESPILTGSRRLAESDGDGRELAATDRDGRILAGTGGEWWRTAEFYGAGRRWAENSRNRRGN